MFKKSLELEPDYGLALSGVAYVLNRDLLLDNVESFERTTTECLKAAKRALVVESFGLSGAGYHARDEYIEIDSIAPRLYLVARLLIELAEQ